MYALAMNKWNRELYLTLANCRYETSKCVAALTEENCKTRSKSSRFLPSKQVSPMKRGFTYLQE